MTRRGLIGLLCVLLLGMAALGFVGCKQEKEAVPKETATAEEKARPETLMPDTAGVEDTTGDFEEEEGVQQEPPPQYDY
jgi:hypothetical protein